MVDAAKANHLYLGDGAGHFRDATAQAGVANDGSMGQGVCVADVDADGDLDIFVANFGQSNKLYLNDGTARFRDASAVRGLASAQNSFGCAFGDSDGDGDLDL